MTMRPAWDWEFLDRADQPMDRPLTPAFTNRFDAESWLGENWRKLVAQGVAAVRLAHDGHPAAPPLSLREP
jgi:hypothetical protein